MSSEELIDALDKDGHPTGELKTKIRIIEDGDWREVIHVWVVNPAKELLVQKRVHKGLWDDLWDVSVGGGVSAGEKPEHAAVRELVEELGLKTEQSALIRLGRWEISKPIPERKEIAHEFSHTFLLAFDVKIPQLKPAKEEVAEVKLLSLSALRTAINNDSEYKKWVPHPQEYYLEVIDKIGGLL